MVSRQSKVVHESKLGACNSRSRVGAPKLFLNSGKIKSGTYHVVGQLGIGLTTTAQTAESVEHAGAHEADESDHAELELGGGVPANIPLTNADALVHPTAGTDDIVSEGRVGSDLSGRSLGFGLCHGERCAGGNPR